MVHSFRKFNRAVTALACLLLASKVEETPKKCRDIVAGAQRQLPAEQFGRMGSNPVVRRAVRTAAHTCVITGGSDDR
jgi:hypothetical protein